MKDIAKTAFILCLIAVVAGLLLGGVNELTYMTEAEKNARNFAKVYELKEGEAYTDFKEIPADDLKAFTVRETFGEIQKIFYMPSKNVYIYQTESKGFAKGLVMMFCVEDNKIVKMKKIAGGETLSKPFKDENFAKYMSLDLTTVKGFVSTDAKYNKDDSDDKQKVDAVTGATMSSDAIAYAADTVVAYHQVLVTADYHNTHPVEEGGAE